MTNMTDMTNKEYAETGGFDCPYCYQEKSVEVCGLFESQSRGNGTQLVECDKCGKIWLDSYVLTGFINM